MSEETLLEPPVMTTATPPAAPRATVQKIVPQPPLSLTKAAKAVDVSTSTLRRAIRDGRLKAVKTEEGHYRIKIDELMQYKANELDTPVGTGATGVSTQHAAGSSTQGAAGRVAEAVDTPAAEVSRDVMLREVHEAKVEGLTNEIRLHKDINRRLEGEIESWKEEAGKWQKQTESYQLLLTDEREKLAQQEPDINLSEVGQGRRAWWYAFAAVAIIAVIGAGYFYRAELGDQWAKFSAANDSGTAVVEWVISQG